MEVIRDYSVSYTHDETMTKVFSRMFIGLLITALTSFFVYSSGMITSLLASSSFILLAIFEVAIVLIFSLLFKKLSPIAVSILFYLYAFINGLTLSTIFMCYEIGTISYAFLATALLFGGLAVYGKKTNQNVAKWGTILFVAMIVGIIMSIINIFIGSSMIDIVLDWVMLAVFSGLTIYDVNKIQNMQNYVDCDNDKLYVYGAMELYLDFINMFLRILQILGRRRD